MSDYRIELRFTGMSDFAGRHTTITKTVVFATGNEPRSRDFSRAEAAYADALHVLTDYRHLWDIEGSDRIRRLVKQINDDLRRQQERGEG